MPRFFPSAMPVNLATRPALRGEKRIWEALREAPLPPATWVFYNAAPMGCRRRIDFLILDPGRGIIAIEVKGGHVHYRTGFRQRIAGQPWSKRIEPWAQAARALAQALAALDLNPIAVPQAFMLALPATSRADLPFPAGPHMLMAEDLAPARLASKLNTLLPRLDPLASATIGPILDRMTAALIRGTDKHRGLTRKPILMAYVQERRSGWLRIGVARRRGKRINVILDALPLHFKGRMVLAEHAPPNWRELSAGDHGLRKPDEPAATAKAKVAATGNTAASADCIIISHALLASRRANCRRDL